MIYAAILAGGVGKRMERQSIPKQFISVGGKAILIRTVERFLEVDRFDAIYIAIHDKWDMYLHKLLAENFTAEEQGRIRVVIGGQERLDSFLNIAENIVRENGENQDDILICHDAVRPFVSRRMIEDCINATLEDKFALTVVPTSDTIHVSHDGKYIDDALDRDKLYNGQNPSGFYVNLLREVCSRFSEEEKADITGTTQLMLRSGYKLRMVKGSTDNFKITTDSDLDIAERMLKGECKTRKIQLLDCTLRDGGIAINFDFGEEKMTSIKECLEQSGVDVIECGYINETEGSKRGRTCFDSELSVRQFLQDTGKKPGVSYVAMIDYGTFDITRLPMRDCDGIDGIRLAFHKENREEAIRWGHLILEKGYDLYIQPMVSTRYTDDEFCALIKRCNNELADASGFYIVDSFGQMDNEMLLRKVRIADQRLRSNIKLGFHAHNNRQMAYSNALAFLHFNSKHDMMLDSSIMGMGKGAGNLCTELIAVSLIEEGKKYQIQGLYEIISKYFSEMIKEHPWGYNLEYYLSSVYSCTPSYINIFTQDVRVTTDVLIELLKGLPDGKKAACDRKFAIKYLAEYFE